MSNNEISWRLRDLAADDYQTPHEREVLILAADVLDAIPGDDKLAVAEWAVKIAAELMDEWEEGSTHADTYYIVEHWWRACPPSVRAALLSNGGES